MPPSFQPATSNPTRKEPRHEPPTENRRHHQQHARRPLRRPRRRLAHGLRPPAQRHGLRTGRSEDVRSAPVQRKGLQPVGAERRPARHRLAAEDRRVRRLCGRHRRIQPLAHRRAEERLRPGLRGVEAQADWLLRLRWRGRGARHRARAADRRGAAHGAGAHGHAHRRRRLLLRRHEGRADGEHRRPHRRQHDRDAGPGGLVGQGTMAARA